jgi:fructuronate reductase
MRRRPAIPADVDGDGVGRLLRRGRDGRAAAPVRIAHLGLGNFFRAHQAWYTEHAVDGNEWGMAAFTGRSAGVATELAEQDGLFTLLVRGPGGDRTEVVSSLSEVHSSQGLAAWRACFARPELAIVTITVTEAGYRRDSSGGLDLADPDVAADLESLRASSTAGNAVTAPGKLVAGLLTRREAGLPGVTFVPCDNVPDNGEMVRRVVLELAESLSPDLAAWIEDTCTFVTTMVDRITPRATETDRADLLSATGVRDPACVVTEPYSEWVLSGDFVAGRPAWESVGARFVDDLEPWEQRKLWLLNGSHSLMAYAGPLRGARTVAEAIADPLVRGWVEQWWDEAAQELPLPADEIDDYRAALSERFSNPRIRHQLAQIAADGWQKLPIRIVPVLRSRLAAGDVPLGATRAIAAWTLHLRGRGSPVSDTAAEVLRGKVATASLTDAVALVLAALEVDDPQVRSVVRDQARELRA